MFWVCLFAYQVTTKSSLNLDGGPLFVSCVHGIQLAMMLMDGIPFTTSPWCWVNFLLLVWRNPLLWVRRLAKTPPPGLVFWLLLSSQSNKEDKLSLHDKAYILQHGGSFNIVTVGSPERWNTRTVGQRRDSCNYHWKRRHISKKVKIFRLNFVIFLVRGWRPKSFLDSSQPFPFLAHRSSILSVSNTSKVSDILDRYEKLTIDNRR